MRVLKLLLHPALWIGLISVVGGIGMARGNESQAPVEVIVVAIILTALYFACRFAVRGVAWTVRRARGARA